MKLATILPLVALAATATSAAAVEPRPDPNQVYVKGVNYNGSGCPITPASAKVVLSEDKQSFTVTFDKFIASAGPGIARTENRKNCQLTIELHIPGGWQYSIALRTSVGDGHTTTTEMSVSGPIAKNYAIRDEIEFTSQSWSPCGEDRPVNINTSIFVSNTKNPKAGGVLTTDSVDGKIIQKYQFQWKKCPQTKA
ncbi:hypothetical protein SpCBS45565_g04638 [Spizellomyces sp. 'palustris']|nr:hypothetical protein SpCBS45565_g04638 [Spizellomyces sp. 'palustris']